MEIKSELKKPYTDKERMNFIVEQNHKNGYTIEETDNALLAWGLSDEELEEKEQEKIDRLTMTALDFIGVLQDFGISLEQINAYLESNLQVKMQLTYCQNVYCGVVKSLMPITLGDITITADMVEIAFKVKNGETIE